MPCPNDIPMPLPPNVTLFHVGAEVKDNVSVESLDYSRVVLGVGQPMQLRANLRNWGERPYPELRVYFRVDGKELFDSIIVITDRRILDDQIKNTIKGFMQVAATVGQLPRALELARSADCLCACSSANFACARFCTRISAR